MADYKNIISILPTLTSLNRDDVQNWYNDFDDILKLYDVHDADNQYRLVRLKLKGEPKEALLKLKEESGDEYPNLEQIKDALLSTTTLTDIELYDQLKAMTIKPTTNIRDFNKEYLGIYNQLGEEFKRGIKVKDYLKSIRSRKEHCRTVLYDEAATIEEACKSSEKVQSIMDYEKEIEELDRPSLSYENKKNRWPGPTNFYNRESKNAPPKYFYQKGESYEQQDTRNSRPSTVPVLQGKKQYVCLRCGEEGHKGFQCPYDDATLVKVLTERLQKETKTQMTKEKEQKN